MFTSMWFKFDVMTLLLSVMHYKKVLLNKRKKRKKAMATRASLTNRGSNLISAMNQMKDQSEVPSQDLYGQATDGTGLITHEPISTKPKSSKIILAIVCTVCVAALIAVIIVLVKRNEDSSEQPLPELIACAFNAPYKNWVNYGLNGTGVTCPTTGEPMECTYSAQCMSVNPLCLPGTPAALSCVEGTCTVMTTVMPDFYHAGGLCNTSSTLRNCALCTSGACDGIALCVSDKDCASTSLAYSLECHGKGHEAN